MAEATAILWSRHPRTVAQPSFDNTGAATATSVTIFVQH